MADSTTDTILGLEERRYQAMVDADVGVLDELCADDLTYTHSNGIQDSKLEYLEKVRSGTLNYQWVKHPVDRVVDEGNVALVLGRMSAEVIVDGDTRQLKSLALAVWAHRAQGWQLIGYQPTPVR